MPQICLVNSDTKPAGKTKILIPITIYEEAEKPEAAFSNTWIKFAL